MKLHLFSSPGQNDLSNIIEASRPYLENKPESRVAYLPLGSLFAERWLDITRDAFQDLATVDLINTETMTLLEIQDILRRASLLYIPGGNTFLLNHRLHISKLMSYLRKLVQSNLPVVAFSAGTVLCGQDILTSKDLNSVGTPYFEGLKAIPYNFLVHYGENAYLQVIHDNWLVDYHVFQDNPVIIMADNAYVKMDGKKAFLERGDAWILRKGQEKEKLTVGELI